MTRIEGPEAAGAAARSRARRAICRRRRSTSAFRSTPNYDALAAQAVRQLSDGSRVFAGQRDDPFFVDLNVFDLLAVPPADINNFDALAGKNVHTIAIEVPMAALTAHGRAPGVGRRPGRHHRRLVHGEPAERHQSRKRPREAQQAATCRSRASVSRSSTKS